MKLRNIDPEFKTAGIVLLSLFIILAIFGVICVTTGSLDEFDASNDVQGLEVQRPQKVIQSGDSFFYMKEVVVNHCYTPFIVRENYNKDIKVILFDNDKMGISPGFSYNMLVEDKYLYLKVSAQQNDNLFKINWDTGSIKQCEIGNFNKWCVLNEIVYYQALEKDGEYKLTALNTSDAKAKASVPNVVMDKDSDLALRGDWLYYTNKHGYMIRYNLADKRNQMIIDEPIYCFDLLGNTVIFSPDIKENRYAQSTSYFEMGTSDIKPLDHSIASSFDRRIVRDNVFFTKQHGNKTKLVVFDEHLNMVSEHTLYIKEDYADVLGDAIMYVSNTDSDRIISQNSVKIEPLVVHGDCDYPVKELDRYHVVDCHKTISITNDQVQSCFDIVDSTAGNQSAACTGVSFSNNVIILDNSSRQIAYNYYEDQAATEALLAKSYEDIEYIVCITDYTLGEKFSYVLGPAIGYRININICVIEKASGKVVKTGIIEGPEPPDMVEKDTEVAFGHVPNSELLFSYLASLN